MVIAERLICFSVIAERRGQPRETALPTGATLATLSAAALPPRPGEVNGWRRQTPSRRRHFRLNQAWPPLASGQAFKVERPLGRPSDQCGCESARVRQSDGGRSCAGPGGCAFAQLQAQASVGTE